MFNDILVWGINKNLFISVHNLSFSAWKVSKLGVFAGPYYSNSDWIWTFTEWISVFSPNAANEDQKNLQI